MSDTNFHETDSLSEVDRDRRGLADPEATAVLDYRDNPIGQLDDRTIVWRFAQGKKRLVVNQHLRIDYAHNSLQLSTPTGELIAIHKVAEKLHYILVKKDSNYSEMIQNTISEFQFIPIDNVTSERGFMRYQKYEIPANYTLQYDLAEILWQAWQEHKQPIPTSLRLDVLILARSKWYRVQDMICADNRLDLQTRLGLISFSLRDRIAWISKLGDLPRLNNFDLTPSNGGTDSEILGKIISKLAIEATPDGDLDDESTVTMSKSVFSQPDDLALLYAADKSSEIEPDHRLSPAVAQQLRARAIGVLENYLEHGETIVRTETIVDAQGNPLGEKTITTQRSCPRWAIEAIVNWQ
ncbi:hypothetical protein [Chamaesiphon sp. OTE_75_metabat_556]|uniref:hypothetical protein n=1 Tax=Chamaesiphon sp. OTE_75_metabat_556 TaxID=2964692 RepID=UPI00286D3372|nr:hypothetical protein [Chamaesiphon sp. OTE_75_metabat_556]